MNENHPTQEDILNALEDATPGFWSRDDCARMVSRLAEAGYAITPIEVDV